MPKACKSFRITIRLSFDDQQFLKNLYFVYKKKMLYYQKKSISFNEFVRQILLLNTDKGRINIDNLNYFNNFVDKVVYLDL